MVRALFRLPNKYPSAATILTGLVSVAFIVVGISHFQTEWAFILVGAFLSIFVAYTIYETRGLRVWASVGGTSALARWVGPLVLIIAILWLVITLEIAFFLIRALSR